MPQALRFLSLFSGIEAASVAWESLGWTCVGVAEIEPLPCRLLAARYPRVPNLGDVTKINEATIAALGHVDVVIFGSPCQDLSLAGNREGLSGERSGLFWDAVRIVGWLREHCGLRFALWENVPGAFSSNEGRDFACVVAALAGEWFIDVPTKGRKEGWGNEGAYAGPDALVEWATLDAQWFGVPQRRRRVFALADFGEWTRRPPILLEPESVRGHIAASEGQGQDVAGSLTTGLGRRSAEGGERSLLLPSVAGSITACLGEGVSGQQARAGLLLAVSNAEGAEGPVYLTASNLSKQFNNQQPLLVLTGDGRIADPLTANEQSTYTHEGATFRLRNCLLTDQGQAAPIVVFSCKDYGADASLDVAPTMRAMGHAGSHANAGGQLAFVNSDLAVRRFTPLECERLQGFDDHWTALPKTDDGPRYKALGNSMAVPVINWIGRSLQSAISEFWTS